MKKILIAGAQEQTGNYRNALFALGAKPESLLLHSTASIARFDGLLLPGGGDIDPSLFGCADHGSRCIDKALDRAQLALLHEFVSAQKPVLGICKGMQLINVYFGGTICQHLPTHAAHEAILQDRTHATAALSGTLLSGLYGARFTVNSAHHQGIEKPGRQLTVIQYADDRVCEGICHTALPVYGVQWHPERMCFAHAGADTVDGSALLAAFLSGFD